MTERLSFEALHQRAYALADTGKFAHWKDVGAELEREGFDHAVRLLLADPVLRTALTSRCWVAKERNTKGS